MRILIVAGMCLPLFLAQASLTRAATRTTAPLEMTRLNNPEAELECLEEFINSNFTTAHRLCLSLAQRGMTDAQLVTGLMYALGEGTAKNHDLAKLWLREALRNGSGEAEQALIEFDLLD